MILLSIPAAVLLPRSITSKMLGKKAIFCPIRKIRSGVPEDLPAEIPATLVVGNTGTILVPSMSTGPDTGVYGLSMSEVRNTYIRSFAYRPLVSPFARSTGTLTPILIA